MLPLALKDPASSGSVATPSGPTAAVEENYNSGEDFRWFGNDDGDDYAPSSGAAHKSNKSVSLYPSCIHVGVQFTPLHLSTPLPVALSTQTIDLPQKVRDILSCLPLSTIFGITCRRFAVVNTSTTANMFPDKSAFISYKTVANLQVRMGNNTFIPVLGQGSAIVSLNRKCVLVCNALYIPGLVLPLYSLHAHLTQRGCGFIGTYKSGFLVYFPSTVLSVNMSTDYHLSYEPFGSGAPLDSLHYVQPRCSPTLYPSKFAASSIMTTPSPAVVEDDNYTTQASLPVVLLPSQELLPSPIFNLMTSLLRTCSHWPPISVLLWIRSSILCHLTNLLLSHPLPLPIPASFHSPQCPLFYLLCPVTRSSNTSTTKVGGELSFFTPRQANRAFGTDYCLRFLFVILLS